MKTEFAHALIQDFLIANADALDIHKDDIKNWVLDYFGGVMPDHNKFYEIRALIHSYLIIHRDGIYRIDYRNAEKYFKQHPEKEKEFKEKRKAKA